MTIAESHGFLRAMPDSTGKRLPMTVMMELVYDNGTVPIAVGDVLVGTVSGVIGTVLSVSGSTSTGELHLLMDDPVANNALFSTGEFLTVSGGNVAKASHGGIPYYFQQLNIAGGRDARHLLEIDSVGAAFTRYAEGSPQFDAYGKMQVSAQRVVAEYVYPSGVDTDRISVTTVGDASVAPLSTSGGLLLSIGTGAGDKAEIVSHHYHVFKKGMSRLVEFTNSFCTTGQDNLSRVFGYGDDDNGVFFCQHNGVVSVEERSSVTGSVTHAYKPQSEWSVDRMDGTRSLYNPSGHNMDWSKFHLTWVDMQYPGGTVRFGVVFNGERIVCHEWHHSNLLTAPYMASANLPIYAELTNTGVTGSGSEMRIWTTVVKNEGDVDLPAKDFSHIPTEKSISGTSPLVLTSIRAKQEVVSGHTNRRSAYITSVSVLSNTDPVIIELWKNPVFSGGNWGVAVDAAHALQFDEVGTVSGGRRLYAEIVDQTGTVKLDLRGVFNSMDEAIRRHFNPSEYDTYTLTARRVGGGGGATLVSMTINWEEGG